MRTRATPLLAGLGLIGLLVGCKAAAPPAAVDDVAVATATAVEVAQPTTAAAATTFDHGDFSTILAAYVKDGKFDYAALKANAEDSAHFESYLQQLGAADPAGLSKEDRYAFWVNAYNAFNIKAVLDHWPTTGPKAVEGYFDKIQYRVGGEDMTINDMEYVKLIPEQNDGRAHFAVVCADNGSMSLETAALTPDNLESTLEKKTREFVSSEKNFKVDREKKVVYVSQLFEWYDADFTADPKFKGKKGVEYLIPYVDADTAAFLAGGDYTVEFIPWDWSLNSSAAE